MTFRKIPRWDQCGIFSIRPVWALPVWVLFLSLTLHGQTLPRRDLHGQAARTLAAPTGSTKDLTILALRVAFAPDEDLSTTGDGTFLMDIDSLDIGLAPCDGFLVDRPPHGAPYFYSQLEAVANYYADVSDSNVTFDLGRSLVYPEGEDPIVLEDTMASYRPAAVEDSSDDLLVALFAESLLAAAADSDVNVMDYDMVVVFHAGLGQDFVYPALDPTPKDIPSAYIDLDMVHDALGTRGIPLPNDILFDRSGLLLPEGQNHIYYDIVEDVFPGETDYCDMQIGLTGTFALLLGYALGLPPLFDTDDGVTGVGVFGLMDVGSNNGQGVIPAPPTAWTRVYLDWKKAIELEGDITLAARHLPEGQIGRITLSNDEYLLVENRVNWIPHLPGVDLDSLRYRNCTEETPGVCYELPPYFDYLVDSVGVDTSNGVITSIPNYDLGLPGSGLLIWHVDKSRYSDPMRGINDNPEARAVALVEADGAVDIGFPTTATFGDPTQGWRWDLWYAGNEGFFMANPDREAGNHQGLLSFDSDTRPSTQLNSGAASGIALWGIGPAGNSLAFHVVDENVTRLPEGSRMLGYNGEEWIYAYNDSLWLGDGNVPFDKRTTEVILTRMVSEHDAPFIPSESIPYDPGFWIIDWTETGGRARRFFLNGDIHRDVVSMVQYVGAYYNEGILWIITKPEPSSPDTINIVYVDPIQVTCHWGYLFNTKDLVPVVLGPLDSTALPDTFITWPHNDRISLGDIDADSLDEIVAVDSDFPSAASVPVRAYRMTAENADGTVLDGFPVSGDFQSHVLIANLMDDIRPELVVVESGDIAIYSPEGRRLARLGLHAEPDDLFLMHFFADSLVGLANGDRIHWFNLNPEDQNPQWVTPQGRHSRSRYSLNDGEHTVPQPAVLDKDRAYNYPNPVTNGRTTIRFYTGTASRATIRIYTVDGLPVAKKEITDLAVNDYNEWIWVVGDNPSGLYYAVVEVQGSETISALVKIAVIR